ncbi:hypothetical protein BCT45_05195 [Vibrio breoganii]|nr:hypothetical protein BCT45_05195 [Vibrio breoganii]
MQAQLDASPVGCKPSWMQAQSTPPAGTITKRGRYLLRPFVVFAEIGAMLISNPKLISTHIQKASAKSARLDGLFQCDPPPSREIPEFKKQKT